MPFCRRKLFGNCTDHEGQAVKKKGSKASRGSQLSILLVRKDGFAAVVGDTLK